MQSGGFSTSVWRHAPAHVFEPSATYFVTGATYRKAKLFDTESKRDFLLSSLFELAERWQWRLQAWAILPNHYHLVAIAPDEALTLKTFIRQLHSKTSVWVNKVDNAPGRKVWYQYWDTCLTYQRSYLARLSYVHNNPVRHGLVTNAEQYRWCSMAWFTANAPTEFARTVLELKTDKINVHDDF